MFFIIHDHVTVICDSVMWLVTDMWYHIICNVILNSNLSLKNKIDKKKNEMRNENK